ncbi:MAG: DUF1667 domain-containing protein [Clostridia bacterium]|nr:DUF1667 domain-containing protein [Clostridia bacterium]
MEKQLTCVACPRGCSITVTLDGDSIVSIEGNACPRGKKYAENEITDPRRMVASTVKVNGGKLPVVPVKTSSDIPKNMIFDVMREINRVSVDAPVEIGQVIIPDVLGTGADIIATNND